jgi:MFS transporter, DHA1 family, inner membrane transport protein
MGVPLAAVTSLIAVNQVTGILSLFFGPMADRWGYRVMLMTGLGFLAAGMLGSGFFPFYGVVLVGLFLAGLGKSAFDPALLAYVGERVPFQRRGLFVGFMETSWAASTLLGVPLVGFLIARLGWRGPFFAIGFPALLGLGALALLIPGRSGGAGTKAPLAMSRAWKKLVNQRPGLGILGFSFFLSMANDNFFVVYGAWMEQTFRLSVVALGVTASVIGVAELLGEALTATVGDRLGLRRSMTMGLILSTGSYLLLPLLEASLSGGLGALFCIFLFTELAIVSALSLSTEVMPDARATMMSGYLAAASLGRVCGALMGGFVWSLGGLRAVAFVSASTNALAMLSFLRGLRFRVLRRA